MKQKPDSKAGQIRAANKLLHRLLRTPKTRAGLIAAVTSSGKVSRNFVYGWLSENTRTGVVTVFKASGKSVTYQIADHVVVEVAAGGEFPSWLEPRVLPMATSREVFIAGSKTKATKE